jgi:hypothetical protein
MPWRQPASLQACYLAARLPSLAPLALAGRRLTHAARRPGRCGVVSGLRQLLEFGLFHGDPHPGNIFALKDGRIAYVDFGNVAELSARNKQVGRPRPRRALRGRDARPSRAATHLQRRPARPWWLGADRPSTSPPPPALARPLTAARPPHPHPPTHPLLPHPSNKPLTALHVPGPVDPWS